MSQSSQDACPSPLGTYQEHSPSSSLNAFVACYWQATGSGDFTTPSYSIIPDGCIDVVYEQQSWQVRCMAFGTTTSVQTFVPAPQAVYFGIRFRPGMARHFLRCSIPELTDNAMTLSSFLSLASDEVIKSPTLGERQVIIEEAMARQLSRVDYTVTQLDRTLRVIHDEQGLLRIDDLANQCGVSTRHLERQIIDSVGLPPKRLSRILRVQTALSFIRRSPHQSLADLALSLGYHDQAHMNRDFSLLTNRTPAYYRTASVVDLQASNLASLTVSDFSKT